MPIPVSTLQIPATRTENFFNDLEVSLLNTIVAGGSGFYKLTQDGNGLFLAVEPVTELPDDAILNEELGDRYYNSDETHLYIYVNFEVVV